MNNTTLSLALSLSRRWSVQHHATFLGYWARGYICKCKTFSLGHLIHIVIQGPIVCNLVLWPWFNKTGWKQQYSILGDKHAHEMSPSNRMLFAFIRYSGVSGNRLLTYIIMLCTIHGPLPTSYWGTVANILTGLQYAYYWHWKEPFDIFLSVLRQTDSLSSPCNMHCQQEKRWSCAVSGNMTFDIGIGDGKVVLVCVVCGLCVYIIC